MSTQRETDAEAGKERFTPKAHEKGENPHPRSLVDTEGTDVDDYLGEQVFGTDRCFGCGERVPVRVLDPDTWFCRVCQEADR